MRGDISKLIDAGRLAVGDELFHLGRRSRRDVTGRVTNDGIEVKGTTYTSLSTAATRLAGHPTNGWIFWRVRATGQPIAELRKSVSTQFTG